MSGMIIISIVTFVLFVLTHIMLFHFKDVKRKFRTMMLLFVMCGLINILSGFLFFNGLVNNVSIVLIIFFIYWFSWFFYAHFIIVINRSISVRVLTELVSSKNGLTEEQIRARYSLKDKIEDEIKDMCFLGYMSVSDDESLSNMPRGERHARIISFIKKFMNLPKNR